MRVARHPKARATAPCHLILATLLLSATAAAEEVTREVRIGARDKLQISYEAPADCPDLDRLLKGVQARLGQEWASSLWSVAPALQLSIARVDGLYRGRLEFRDEQGERATRSVSGGVCAQVVDGMALMAALAVQARVEGSLASGQPMAELVRPSEPAPSTGGGPPTSAGGDVTKPSDELTRSAPRTSRTVTPRRERVDPKVPKRELPSREARLRIGGLFALTSGVGPSLAWGPGAFGTLQLGKARLGLALNVVSSGAVRAGAVSAEFRLVSGRFDACPTSLQLGSWLALEPCAFAEVGAFRALARLEPPQVVASHPQSIAWGALGVLGRSVLGAGAIQAHIELLGRIPLRRERFFVESRDQVVFRIPALSGGALLGLGLKF